MNIKRFSIPLLSFLLAVSFSYFYFTNKQGTVVKDTKAQYLKGGAFNLSNAGNPFNLEDMKGKPVILYFGYMSCPDICPVGLAVIRDTLNLSREFESVMSLFITLDPERDSSENLNEYASFFHENIKGLTGELSEIKAVAALYGTYFRKTPVEAHVEEYSVDHTAYFYLLSDDGELMRVMDHDATPSQLAEVIKQLL